MAANPDRQISETIEREQCRLRNFIRSRVPDSRDSEDILQDVFYELVEAYHLMKPIEQVGAWLFRVARHRIIDFCPRRNRKHWKNFEPFLPTAKRSLSKTSYLRQMPDPKPSMPARSCWKNLTAR